MKKTIFLFGTFLLICVLVANAATIEVRCGDLVGGIDPDGIITCPAFNQIYVSFYVAGVAASDNMFTAAASIDINPAKLSYASSGKYLAGDFMESNGGTAVVTGLEDPSGDVDTVDSITGTPNPDLTPIGGGYCGQHTLTCTFGTVIDCTGDGDIVIVDTRDVSTSDTLWTDTNLVPHLFEEAACVDNDGDGYGSPGDASCPNGAAEDCDDTDANINPGATDDAGDDTDENCDGYVVCYNDADSDGYGTTTSAESSFTATNGVADTSGACGSNDADTWDDTSDDCDDTDDTVYPGAAELCDGKNNDCDAGTADGVDETWYGDACDGADSDLCQEGVYQCTAGSQTCNDNDAEHDLDLCNGLDDDCNAATDDGVDETWYNDPTNCGVGECSSTGNLICSSGVQTDTCTPGTPSTEVCDNLDNNCDGNIDESLTQACYTGPPATRNVGECQDGTQTCTAGVWGSCVGEVTPITEICSNGLDDDCDGVTDEYPNLAPVANADGPYDVIVGDSLQLDATASSDPDESCGDSIASYEWDLDDDGAYDDESGSYPLVTWTNVETYVCGGSCVVGNVYNIAMMATDSNGASSVDTSTVTILECDSDADCDNGDYCDGAETCDLGTNTCQDASDIDCSHLNDQCNVGVCNEGTDSCEADSAPYEGLACNDLLWCNIGETCQSGLCAGGSARDCSDANECTSDNCIEDAVPDQGHCDNPNLAAGILCGSTRDCPADACNGVFAEFYPVDGHDSCDGAGSCNLYSCTLEDTYCTDDDIGDGVNTLECGAECDQDTDCTGVYCTLVSHKTYEYGECDNDCSCTGAGSYSCVVGSCGALCDEDTDCSCAADYCEGTTLIDYPDYGRCGTAGEEGCLCQVGTGSGEDCEPTPIVDAPECEIICYNDGDCNDGNVCTDDVCLNPGTQQSSCQYTNNNNACDDSDACTTDDTCADGVCVGGPALVCNDNNECTEDSCDSGTGCVFDPAPYDGNACDDGEYCTVNEYCSDGMCNYGSSMDCSDGVDCTIDSCDEVNDRCDNVPNDNYCDDSLVCNGDEWCDAIDDCQAGTAVDCSGNDISGVAECTYTPDANPYTWDYRDAFTSVCEEPAGSCTTGSTTITHDCDVAACSADCDATTACDDTECDQLDGCVGDDYYDYDDRGNDCLGDCSCEDNTCSQYTIYTNDPRCGECTSDADCTHLTNQCNVGRCDLGTYTCYADPVADGTSCGSSSDTECDNPDSCSAGTCEDNYEPLGTDCDVCAACDSSGSCSVYDDTQDVDCADTLCPDDCGLSPDDNPFTWDYADDVANECTAIFTCSNYACSYTHECSVSSCSADCDATTACDDTECDGNDGCVGDDYYDYDDVANACLGDCTCEQNSCGAPTISYNDPACTECQTDDDCDSLDADYCSGDNVMHDEGRCVDFACQAETTVTEDCNDLDDIYCLGTEIWSDDYTCSGAACTSTSSLLQDCDDGLACNGDETCSNAACVAGTAVDCSGNDITAVAECTYTPDANPYTWDYRDAFTSVCEEPAGTCTTGDSTVTSTCDVAACSADCDATNACDDTECDQLDGCVDDDYYDYDDVANACLGDCTCEQNSCGAPTISYNDPACTECQTDDDCDSLDADYCSGDNVMHDEGRCVDFACQAETTVVEDCNNLDDTYCLGTEIWSDDYTCSGAACALDTSTMQQDCDDGFACNGDETCSNAACVAGTAVDCSGNDITAVAECTYTPDANPYTWDYRDAFTSVCEEPAGSCTTGDSTITHDCADNDMFDSVPFGSGCDAECDQDTDCADTDCDGNDGCVDDDYYDYDDVANACLGDCTCEQNSCGAPTISYNDPACTECQTDVDCNSLDADYCSVDDVMHDEGRCVNFACQTETTVTEYCNDLDDTYCSGTEIWEDDYTCSGAACALDTSTMQQDCDDGLACNGDETCSNANCQPGTPIDCSANDITAVAECTYTPDANPYTWDYRDAFTSVCEEPAGSCTTGDSTITHDCADNDMFDSVPFGSGCDAECDQDTDCADTECDGNDGCDGDDYYDYDDVANACLGDCSCEDNACTHYTIYYNDPRCTECQTDDDCNLLDDDYCSGDNVMHDEGRCVDFACQAETTVTEDCNDLDDIYCLGTEIWSDDYTCSGAACTSTSSLLQDCDDGLACNGDETCSNANCVAGTAVDCSGNDITAVAECTYTPDANPYTWDYRDAFTSVCEEPAGSCTTGDETITHTCDVDCGADAECDGVIPGTNNCDEDCKVFVGDNEVPFGWFDDVNCERAGGWTRDPNTEAGIPVHFYVSEDSNTLGDYVGSQVADVYRPDLCNYISIGCNHAFHWLLPNSLKDGKVYYMRVIAIDYGGSDDVQLGSVPFPKEFGPC